MNNIKVLLMSISNSKIYSNTGIDMLCGYLRRKYNNIDTLYFHQGETIDKIISSIPMGYDLYGFSVYSSNFRYFIQITEKVKALSPKSKVVWGGSFPTMFYKDIFEENQDVDYIILGDGEIPLEYLIRSLQDNCTILCHESIASKNDCFEKKIFYNQEIKHLPSWDYYEKVMPELNKYKIHCVQSKNNICTGVCSFCYERKGKIVYKDIQQIIDEINYVSKTYSVRKIYFTDDNLLDANGKVAKERTWKLCEELKKVKQKIVYTCYIKAVSFQDTEYDHSLLQLMSDAGFATMFIGIESGSNADLKLYNKLTTVEDNYRIISLLNAHNIVPMTGFINFNPYSTMKTLGENYHFLTNIMSVNIYSYVASFLNIYKYTDIYYRVYNDGLLNPSFDLLNDLDYNFSDHKVDKIVEFIRNNIFDQLKKIKYETSWILSKCEEAIRLDSSAQKIKDELLIIKQKDFKNIKEFFYVLYIENDLKKANCMLEGFLNHFISEQKELRNIFHDIRKVLEYDE